MRRFVLSFVVAMSISALAACSADSEDAPPYDLSIRSESVPFNTKVVLGLTESDGDALIANEGFMVDDGSFHVTYGDILSPATGHTLYLFEDIDGDGSCDAPPVDRMWLPKLPATNGPVTVDLGKLQLEPIACSYFAAQGF